MWSPKSSRAGTQTRLPSTTSCSQPGLGHSTSQPPWLLLGTWKWPCLPSLQQALDFHQEGDTVVPRVLELLPLLLPLGLRAQGASTWDSEPGHGRHSRRHTGLPGPARTPCVHLAKGRALPASAPAPPGPVIRTTGASFPPGRQRPELWSGTHGLGDAAPREPELQRRRAAGDREAWLPLSTTQAQVEGLREPFGERGRGGTCCPPSVAGREPSCRWGYTVLGGRHLLLHS